MGRDNGLEGHETDGSDGPEIHKGSGPGLRVGVLVLPINTGHPLGYERFDPSPGASGIGIRPIKINVGSRMHFKLLPLSNFTLELKIC